MRIGKRLPSPALDLNEEAREVVTTNRSDRENLPGAGRSCGTAIGRTREHLLGIHGWRRLGDADEDVIVLKYLRQPLTTRARRAVRSLDETK
jgi:hypothetical protein